MERYGTCYYSQNNKWDTETWVLVIINIVGLMVLGYLTILYPLYFGISAITLGFSIFLALVIGGVRR